MGDVETVVVAEEDADVVLVCVAVVDRELVIDVVADEEGEEDGDVDGEEELLVVAVEVNELVPELVWLVVSVVVDEEVRELERLLVIEVVRELVGLLVTELVSLVVTLVVAVVVGVVMSQSVKVPSTNEATALLRLKAAASQYVAPKESNTKPFVSGTYEPVTPRVNSQSISLITPTDWSASTAPGMTRRAETSAVSASSSMLSCAAPKRPLHVCNRPLKICI